MVSALDSLNLDPDKKMMYGEFFLTSFRLRTAWGFPIPRTFQHRIFMAFSGADFSLRRYPFVDLEVRFKLFFCFPFPFSISISFFLFSSPITVSKSSSFFVPWFSDLALLFHFLKFFSDPSSFFFDNPLVLIEFSLSHRRSLEPFSSPLLAHLY